jgi:hypothetical protein
MEAIGGFLELWLLFTAGAAVLYFIFEPLVCWLTVGLGMLFGRLFK